MPDVLVRDLDEAVVNRLKERAASQGRSLQSELQQILTDAAGQKTTEEFRRWAEGWRARLADRQHDDSTAMIRQDRDR